MTTKITLAFLLLSYSAFGQQNNFDCAKILNKTPHFLRHSVTGPDDSLQLDFDILRSCGNLDSIDSELLKGPMLGLILVQHEVGDKIITYNTILETINSYKETDDYPKFRDAILASKTLEHKIVMTDTFEKDKELLIKAGLPPSELERFKAFIQADTSQKMTYKEAFDKYTAIRETYQPPLPDKIEFIKLSDIESAIKTGKENEKKVLLYFSGYGCANARKVEDQILTDNHVKSLLAEHFVCFIAYVDDRSKDNASNSTIGKKLIKLQIEKFNSAYQPYFCIIDNDGKVLSEIGYTSYTKEFIAFLNKGLK